ncbi:MAG: phosphoribosylformylglycinamidine synthase I [Candidatus Omnitrophota bacterium]|nr:phosphoribosylformylglycinamidine synthase I [Candidatus Omnitrophota bacterium]
MKKVKTLILRTAGTNCDKETEYAFKAAGSETELVHINVLMKNKSAFGKYQILAIPGGFTYGDDIGSGKILANEIKFNLKNELSSFVKRGNLVIGICNGFQVLVKMGLLPNLSNTRDLDVDATLSLNDSGKFMDKWVYLKRFGRDKCVWAKDLPEVSYLPIAHAEGKFIPRSHAVLKGLQDASQVVFRYADRDGICSKDNTPNGSIDDIAGICDPTGRILGMMPHPERHISYLQHPNWRRPEENKKGMCVGLRIFRNGVKFMSK